jgi:hypothetical protein
VRIKTSNNGSKESKEDFMSLSTGKIGMVTLQHCAFLALFFCISSFALAEELPSVQSVPACTGKTYKETISNYTAILDDETRKQFILALSRLDAWYNVNAEAQGLEMSEKQTNDFLAQAACGQTVARIEELSRRMMHTSTAPAGGQ